MTNISVDPSLFKSLKKGFSSVSDPKLVTLGMRESSKCQKPLDCECSFCKYKSLAMSLKRESLASGYSYKALMDKDKKWHSKIALKVRDGQVLAAIIGSSNLTIPAYGQKGEIWIGKTKNFPYECDVLIWDENRIGNVFESDPDIGLDFSETDLITATPDDDIRPLLNHQLQKIKELISKNNYVFDILN